jgi:hypothetical protein
MVLFLGIEGSEVLSAGSLDISGLNWDKGTVGVSNETSVSSGICVGGNGETESSEVLSTGSLDSGLINGDNSAIGVGNEGSGIGDWVVDVVVGIGVSQTVVVSSCVGESVSSEVSGLSSLDLGGLGGGNGAVGVGDELGAGSSHASEENLKDNERFSINYDNVKKCVLNIFSNCFLDL